MGAGLQWTPALAVGVAAVDAQHQELFRRAERLIVALRGGDRTEVEPLIGYLSDYVISHFQAEDRLMRESAYPQLEEHNREHARFRRRFAELFAGYQKKGPTALVAMTLHNWVQDWLRNHIAGMDQELGRWLSDRRG